MTVYLGIDFGTSGVRVAVIDRDANIRFEKRYGFDASDLLSERLCSSWKQALFASIEQIPQTLRRELRAIAIDGTSSTVLLCDDAGVPVAAPLLYNDGRGYAEVDNLKVLLSQQQIADSPSNHVVSSATSSLVKLLWMARSPSFARASYFLHQADWLAFLLHGQLGIGDYHNALKLGYDVEHFCYPSWMVDVLENRLSKPVMQFLPKILPPGTPVSEVTAEIATRLGLRRDCLVCAGTTDSIAAFLASGAKFPGDGVTSLGSTLVLKLLSRNRVECARYGIYSHRLGNLWLSGGASNTGGAVLRQFFSDAELERSSCHIPIERESQLDYYPLLKPGERFPINDPHLLPRLEPRPSDPVEFLHGLLESMARIEARGYQLLQQVGATPLLQVYTTGGGAINSSWAAIRTRHLQVPFIESVHTEAAYGAALLAMQGAPLEV
jgi:sugar (pentulose or hexulose) kinase